MAPSVGSYRSQEWLDHSGLLYHNAEGFFRLANVCRHRQAVMEPHIGK